MEREAPGGFGTDIAHCAGSGGGGGVSPALCVPVTLGPGSGQNGGTGGKQSLKHRLHLPLDAPRLLPPGPLLSGRASSLSVVPVIFYILSVTCSFFFLSQAKLAGHHLTTSCTPCQCPAPPLTQLVHLPDQAGHHLA